MAQQIDLAERVDALEIEFRATGDDIDALENDLEKIVMALDPLEVAVRRIDVRVTALEDMVDMLKAAKRVRIVDRNGEEPFALLGTPTQIDPLFIGTEIRGLTIAMRIKFNELSPGEARKVIGTRALMFGDSSCSTQPFIEERTGAGFEQTAVYNLGPIAAPIPGLRDGDVFVQDRSSPRIVVRVQSFWSSIFSRCDAFNPHRGNLNRVVRRAILLFNSQDEVHFPLRLRIN